MAVIVLLWGIVAPSAEAATPEEVDAAIKAGVQFLYSQQKGDSWDAGAPDQGGNGQAGQWGGISSLAVYALLADGIAGYAPESTTKIMLRILQYAGSK